MAPQAITAQPRTARMPTLRQRADEPELLDAQHNDPSLLRDNLRDIRRVNRLGGGTAAIMHHLPDLAEAIPHAGAITILDLATGSADIPLTISRWAVKTGRSVQVCASDASEEILAIARDNAAGDPAITFAGYDARSVQLPDGSFDIVLCSLALHHFPPGEAVQVLGEMDRLAVHGFILNDLRRGRAGYLTTWAASRLATRNPLTRHDAPLSIRRAYTPAELRWLLHQAGIRGVRVFTAPWFRMIAIKDKRT